MHEAAALFSRDQAESRVRPLARRRLMTRRPAAVDIRLRNPWVIFRFRVLGWNVRFIVGPAEWWMEPRHAPCIQSDRLAGQVERVKPGIEPPYGANPHSMRLGGEFR